MGGGGGNAADKTPTTSMRTVGRNADTLHHLSLDQTPQHRCEGVSSASYESDATHDNAQQAPAQHSQKLDSEHVHDWAEASTTRQCGLSDGQCAALVRGFCSCLPRL